MSRLNHISTYRDVTRGNPVIGAEYCGRQLYRVQKRRGENMTYVFCLGNHVFDVRDLATVYVQDELSNATRWYATDYEWLRVVCRVLEKSAPRLLFPRVTKCSPFHQQGLANSQTV